MRYDYPRTVDDWATGHSSLHTRCSHLFRAGDGAAALDELHEILFGALSALPPKVEQKRHQKTYKKVEETRGVLRNLRRDLKRAVGQQRLDIKRSIYSALAIQKELKKVHAEEVKAQEIRENVKLLRRNPKKLAQKVWGGNLSSAPQQSM